MSFQLGAFNSAFLFMLLVIPVTVHGRKHHLHLEDDSRRLIPISTFGFLKGGHMSVELHGFLIRQDASINSDSEKVDGQSIGFTIDRTLSDGLNPYTQNIENPYCALRDPPRGETSQRLNRISLIFDVAHRIVKVKCSTVQEALSIYQNASLIPYALPPLKRNPTILANSMIVQRRKRSPQGDPVSAELPDVPEGSNAITRTLDSAEKLAPRNVKVDSVGASAGDSVRSPALPPGAFVPQPLFGDENPKLSSAAFSSEPKSGSQDQEPEFKDPGLPDSPQISEGAADQESGNPCRDIRLPLTVSNSTQGLSYSTSFAVYVMSEEMEGLYNLYFHNCLSYDSSVYLNMSILEENAGKNYLSAGEMPLPALYFMMSIIFFISGCFWVFILRKSKRETGVTVFKIHYLMGALVYLKSLSLLFHAVNYHYIQIEGTQVEGFAVLYYTVHLLKGALLFITILLIGTGYAFVKHLLSDKDKKIFMIVIPLQVLANVAEIIIEESEEAEIVHTTWKVIFISVDLLCCGAILFPVVWSIKHLQEASRTDGKAATNLRKLKLFRHFYIIVVCYIYFTRIIVNLLLRITVPFQYEWLDKMFLELTTFIFFVLTGYKFRPAANNPYLELAHDSDDETDMDIALTESGLTAGVSKRGIPAKKKTLKEIVYFDEDDDEEVLLEKHLEHGENQAFISISKG